MDNLDININIVDVDKEVDNLNKCISKTDINRRVDNLGKNMSIADTNRRIDDLGINIGKVDGEIHNLDIKIVDVDRTSNSSTNIDKKVDR